MLLKSLIPFARPTKTELWAVRELTTSVQPGETVGILGRNGAGKTTLLRLLAGVSRPTAGRLTVRGRIAPLISVGVGFHQEMSGRENIYVNGMLLGLTRAEVRERLDQIVAFSELADFIDTPVKFYSSGMFMRLGFSVAAHVDPEVLLVDEVLAVGDIAFQLKCIDRMRDLQSRGTTIVLVSHSMHIIRVLCPRTLLMRKGRLEFDGDTETAISQHHELLTIDTSEYYASADAETPTDGPGGARIVERQLLGSNGPTNQPDREEILTYRVKIQFDQAVDSPQIFFHVMADIGIPVYGIVTALGRRWRSFAAGETVVADVVFRPRLGGGTYRLVLTITDRNGRQILWADPGGMLMYLPPVLGSSGYAELEGSITIGGEILTDHADLMMVTPTVIAKPTQPNNN